MSDAPNEGREEKPHGYTAGPKFPSMQWPSKSELPNHSEKLEAEIQSLRDQLSKERETIKEKDTWISEERRVSTELGNKLNELEQSLSEERENNKRLEEGISKFVHHWRIFFNSPKVGQPPNLSDLESLISKASELDKN